MAKTLDRGLENREIVLDILTEVLEQGAFVHLVLNQALQKYQYLGKADRSFITRAVEGTLEYLIQIDEKTLMRHTEIILLHALFHIFQGIVRLVYRFFRMNDDFTLHILKIADL